MSQGMSEADKNISLLNIAELSIRRVVDFFSVPDVLFQGQAIVALWMWWRDQGPPVTNLSPGALESAPRAAF